MPPPGRPAGGRGTREVLSSAPVRDAFVAMLRTLDLTATGSATRVTRLLLLDEAPSLDHGELTDKGSINQRAVLTCRAALVDALYDEVGRDGG